MKIVVVKTKFIGDTVLASAFFEALRCLYPMASITALVSPLTKQVLEQCPEIDHFIVTTALNSHTKQTKVDRLKAGFYLAKELKQTQFDRSYNLTRSFFSALIIFFSRIKHRAGLDTDGRSLLLTHPIHSEAGSHEYLINLSILNNEIKDGDIKNNINLIKPKYFVTKVEKAIAENFFLEYLQKHNLFISNFIFVHLSGSNALRRWPASSWAQIANVLAEGGCGIVWSGSKTDVVQMKLILSNLSPKAKVQSVVLPMLMGGDLLPVRQLSAVISLCSASIMVDTGPMHLSAALGIPTLGLFGPGDPIQWHPVGPDEAHASPSFSKKYQVIVGREYLSCRPCFGRGKCKHISAISELPKCMEDILPEDVLSIFNKIFLRNTISKI